MRLLIFLLALSSAFFVSAAEMPAYYDPEGVAPEANIFHNLQCTVNISGKNQLFTGTSKSALAKKCEEYIASNTKYACIVINTGVGLSGQGSVVGPGVIIGSLGCVGSVNTVHGGYKWKGSNTSDVSCPPKSNPQYRNPWPLSGLPISCHKVLEKNYCPEPNSGPQPDPFTFGTSQTEHCFRNPDGTQCKIKTDKDGGYYFPYAYMAQEPSQCMGLPDEPVDKTSPPDGKPAPEETDDTPEMAELDALNKINDNLDAMNENQVAASDSNDERLDRVSEEIQIGNEVLGEIRYNTDLIESNTDDTNGLLGETNALLADILDNTGGAPDDGGQEPCTGDDCETDTFTITAGRKDAEKGLNSIFTDDQRQVITDEIDEKKQEIEDYFEQIESESSALFDINPSLGGGYEERIEVIKGVEVDMGLGRLSSFFQLIAAAVMLCSTLTALYILLGP